MPGTNNSITRIILVKKGSRPCGAAPLELADGGRDKCLGNGFRFDGVVSRIRRRCPGGIATLASFGVNIAEVGVSGRTGGELFDVKGAVPAGPSDFDCHNEESMDWTPLKVNDYFQIIFNKKPRLSGGVCQEDFIAACAGYRLCDFHQFSSSPSTTGASTLEVKTGLALTDTLRNLASMSCRY